MKRLLLAIGVLTGLVVLVSFFSAGALIIEAQDECVTRSDEYTIGFANLTREIVFTQLVEEGIVAKAAEYDNVELVVVDNQLSGAQALLNVDILLAQNVDGVIEFQTEAPVANLLMREFENEGIPVITIDIGAPGAYFFGVDNYNAGALAGQALGTWANENWDGSADYILVLELPQSGVVPSQRMVGQVEALQETLVQSVVDDNVIYLDSQNTKERAFELVTAQLVGIPEGSRVLALNINDQTADGVISAFEAAGRESEVKVVGQGADPDSQRLMLLEDSRMLGSTAYFPEAYGDQLIPMMLDLLECRDVPPVVTVDHVFISAANVCEYYAEAWPDICAAQLTQVR
ncbi:MAG: sugar ABC transporter substrate-binding protein [Chloroflexota bacterium]